MIKILYKPDDLRYLFFRGEDKQGKTDLRNLEKYLNKIPAYQFMRGYRGVPRPEIFLNKFISKNGDVVYHCHSGLYKTVMDWCKNNGVLVDISQKDDSYLKYTGFNLSLEQFTKYVEDWNLNLTPREYQIKAAWLILHYRQSLSQLATRAGKTLIAYIVFRYLLENGVKKILMIVPSVQLVKQGVEDFRDYKEFFQTEQIWAKSEYCDSANLTIGTYQSFIQRLDPKSKKYNPSFFNGYDCILVDEAHHLVCDSINKILNQDFMKHVKLKFGFTGTLPKEDTIESFCCHSLMGPKIQDLTTSELVNGGFLAAPVITQYRIKYEPDEKFNREFIKCAEYLCCNYKTDAEGKKILLPKNQREFTIKHEKIFPAALKIIKKEKSEQDYMDYLTDVCKASGANLLVCEQMLVHRSKKHTDLVKKLVKSTNNKNCIVFAHHTEYVNFLEEELKKEFPEKVIYKIAGSTNLKKRQQIVDKMLENNNIVLVASYGCCSTGITFKNVDYCILAQSFKSDIINLQSIGRMLLKTDEKSVAYIYDIIDIFPTKSIYSQGLAKIKTYKNSKFEYGVVNV